jgi:NAD-dependent DNA ligase
VIYHVLHAMLCKRLVQVRNARGYHIPTTERKERESKRGESNTQQNAASIMMLSTTVNQRKEKKKRREECCCRNANNACEKQKQERLKHFHSSDPKSNILC